MGGQVQFRTPDEENGTADWGSFSIWGKRRAAVGQRFPPAVSVAKGHADEVFPIVPLPAPVGEQQQV